MKPMNTTRIRNHLRVALKHTTLAVAMVAGLAMTTTAAPPPPPGGVTDLVLWLDAGAPDTMTVAADTVTVNEWRDKLGGPAKMTLVSGAPTLVASGIGSIPTVHFTSGSQSRMDDGVNHAAPVTVFYISRQTGGTNRRVLSSDNNNWLLGYWGGNRNVAYFDGWVSGSGPTSDIQAVMSAITLYAVIAWRILYLTHLGRQQPDLPCGCVFEEAEWKAACAVVKRDKNAPEPSIAEFIDIVGKLGGHLGRKSDGPPGPQSIWRGLTRVRDFALAWKICYGE